MSALQDVRDGLSTRLSLLTDVTVRREFGGDAFFVGETKFAAITDRALVLHLPPRDVTQVFRTGQGRPFVSVGALSRHGWIEIPFATLTPQLADPWIEAAYRAAHTGRKRGSSRRPAAARRIRIKS
jgi:hypothetical protein